MRSKQGRTDPRNEAPQGMTPGDLFRLHQEGVFAVCLANTRNHHDAEDVMQSVFLNATAKFSGLREPARARAWLLQLARRKCVDFYRRRKQTEPLLDEPAAATPAADAMVERLHNAIQKLPPSYREAIVLYYLDGRDCSRVAVSLKTTEAAVRQRLVRARTMLHELLREEGP